jgi:hypothetical protein
MAIARVQSLNRFFLKESDTKFSASFFHGSVYPGPMSIPLRQFQICTKIRVDIHNFEFIAGVADTDEHTMTRIFINHRSLLYQR